MGPVCVILGRGDLTIETLTQIDACLDRVANRIERTRKGRHWQLWIADRPLSLSACIPADYHEPWHDIATEAGLCPDDVKSILVVASGLNRSEDYQILSDLSTELARLLDGVPTIPNR